MVVEDFELAQRLREVRRPRVGRRAAGHIVPLVHPQLPVEQDLGHLVEGARQRVHRPRLRIGGVEVGEHGVVEPPAQLVVVPAVAVAGGPHEPHHAAVGVAQELLAEALVIVARVPVGLAVEPPALAVQAEHEGEPRGVGEPVDVVGAEVGAAPPAGGVAVVQGLAVVPVVGDEHAVVDRVEDALGRSDRRGPLVLAVRGVAGAREVLVDRLGGVDEEPARLLLGGQQHVVEPVVAHVGGALVGDHFVDHHGRLLGGVHRHAAHEEVGEEVLGAGAGHDPVVEVGAGEDAVGGVGVEVEDRDVLHVAQEEDEGEARPLGVEPLDEGLDLLGGGAGLGGGSHLGGHAPALLPGGELDRLGLEGGVGDDEELAVVGPGCPGARRRDRSEGVVVEEPALDEGLEVARPSGRVDEGAVAVGPGDADFEGGGHLHGAAGRVVSDRVDLEQRHGAAADRLGLAHLGQGLGIPEIPAVEVFILGERRLNEVRSVF